MTLLLPLLLQLLLLLLPPPLMLPPPSPPYLLLKPWAVWCLLLLPVASAAFKAYLTVASAAALCSAAADSIAIAKPLYTVASAAAPAAAPAARTTS